MKKLTMLFLLFLISTAYSAVVITVTPDRGLTTPSTINISATPNSSVKPYVFEWDFEGDGIIDETTNAPNNSVSHDYTTGIYYPTVTIYEGVTELGTDTKLLIIANAAGNLPPIAYANGPYTRMQNFPMSLDATAPTASIDEDGSIASYSWSLKNTKGTPCPEFTGMGNPVFLICPDPGTAEAELIVTDNLGESTTATTTITVTQVQSADRINIVDLKTEPEIMKTNDTELKIIVRVRNVIYPPMTFNIDYEIKLDEPNIDLSAAPVLISGTLAGQQAIGYSQKDFVITIPNATITANLEAQKNYWVYVTVTTPGETNLTFNTRRTIFNYSESSLKPILADEINFIPIIIVLISVIFILNGGKKYGTKIK